MPVVTEATVMQLERRKQLLIAGARATHDYFRKQAALLEHFIDTTQPIIDPANTVKMLVNLGQINALWDFLPTVVNDIDSKWRQFIPQRIQLLDLLKEVDAAITQNQLGLATQLYQLKDDLERFVGAGSIYIEGSWYGEALSDCKCIHAWILHLHTHRLAIEEGIARRLTAVVSPAPLILSGLRQDSRSELASPPYCTPQCIPRALAFDAVPDTPHTARATS